jgi:general secretion pathway protein E
LSLDQLHPADETFAIDAVDRLLETAIQSGASDLHLNPRASGWEAFLRIDGVLSLSHRISGGGSNSPVTRLMVLANLPTYRSSQPMEGRVRWDGESGNALSMRLGVFPTVHGPRAVVRILRQESRLDDLCSLGLGDKITESLLSCCRQTDGAIFLTGPAGSGKTTTMYAMLRCIADQQPRRSVITIEDPVESVIESINQSELDASGGMTLAAALKSAVRQDSEVLLVSEIRDPETAEAAFQASLTGHLVFSSLHASDVAASLRRLVQFGVPAAIVQSGIRMIVSQRLLRKICKRCGSKPSGDCTDCIGTGYQGRIAIAQCVGLDGSDPVGEALIAALNAGVSLKAMRQAAKEAGGIDLRQQAEALIESKITDEKEVYRVLGSVSC